MVTITTPHYYHPAADDDGDDGDDGDDDEDDEDDAKG
jgi:hypothetical protein